MIIVNCKGVCLRCLLTAVYLIQCLCQRHVGYVSTSNGFANSAESSHQQQRGVDYTKSESVEFLKDTTKSESVEFLKDTTKSYAHFVTEDSRVRADLSSTKIPQIDSILIESATDLTNTQTSKELEMLTESSQFKAVSPCTNITFANVTSIYSPCFISVDGGQTVVDCTGLSIININPAWFPTNTNVILLDNNSMRTLHNCTFSHLRDLYSLSVSENNILNIDLHAFSGLDNLESLNLESNKLGLKYLYPPNVFQPLKKLKNLGIQNNLGEYYDEECYPGSILGKLANLETLTIDSLGNKICFQDDFAELKYLSRVDISGNPKNIDERSFENVRQITSLYLQNIYLLRNFSEEALKPLKTLDTFYLNGVHVGVQKSLRTLKPLRGRNMTSIYFDSVSLFEHDNYAGFIENDGLLSVSKTQYLLEICVQNFTLSGSNIYVIENNALSSAIWHKCLINLDISFNPILGTKIAYFRLLNFKNIETVNMEFFMERCISNHASESLYNSDYNELADTAATTSVQQSSTVTTQINGNDTNDDNNNVLGNYSFSNKSQLVSTACRKQAVDTCMSSHATSEYIWVTVSESLRRMQLSASIGNTKLDRNVKFIGAKRLTFLDVSRGKLYEFRGNITGLDALETFLLSGNDLSSLSDTFFDNFCSLEELLLSDCFLDVNFISRKSARLLMNLPKLKRLDISFNLLNSLASETFTFNRDLEVLNLAKNRFRTIPFNLRDTPNLKVLDIRQNSLSSIESAHRDNLDILSTQTGGFHLLLSGNDISCDCDNFPFLRWLTTTHVQLDEVNLACPGDKKNTTKTGLYLDADLFWRKCLGGFFLALAVSILLLMVIGFLVFFFIWKHHIFIKSTLLTFFTGYKLKIAADYQIGVYIGYSERDYVFPCFQLRRFIEDELNLSTYVYHRDMAGSDMARSISDAVNASWRIVLVITSSFLFDHEWSTFKCTSAIYSQTSENPSRIVVLVDSSLQHQLPPEILSAVNDDNIIIMQNWELTYELRNKLRNRLNQ